MADKWNEYDSQEDKKQEFWQVLEQIMDDNRAHDVENEGEEYNSEEMLNNDLLDQYNQDDNTVLAFDDRSIDDSRDYRRSVRKKHITPWTSLDKPIKVTKIEKFIWWKKFKKSKFSV